jgi:hypothetical protein
LVLSGCALLDSQSGPSSQDPGGGGNRKVLGDFSASATRELDLLFVIDNSATMADEQRLLTDAFPRLLDDLRANSGGLPSLHIGVVSSNVGVSFEGVKGCPPGGDRGRLQSSPRLPGCSAPNGLWIVDEEQPGGPRMQNYAGSLRDVFACIATLGTEGCGFEQHLESMRQSFNTSNGENQGFLRPQAKLAVILVADEDDCSARDPEVFEPQNPELGPMSSFRCTEYGVLCEGRPLERTVTSYQSCTPRGDSFLAHPEEYAAFLKTLRPATDSLYVAAIAGPTDPFTTQPMPGTGFVELAPSWGDAVPAVRLKSFVDQFPGRGLFAPLCSGFQSFLSSVARDLAVTHTQCLTADPRDNEKQEPDCTVIEIYPSGGSRQLQSCDRSPQPCYRWGFDTEGCTATKRGLSLLVERGGSTPDPGTHVVVECVLPG